ncbi:hypothetical protein D3C80_1589590 [compost metagenome]
MASAPVQMAGQAFEQGVEGGLANDLQFAAVQGFKREAGRMGQARVGCEGIGEAQLGILRGIVEHRREFAPQPVRVEVQHAIGETVGGRRIAVMNVARLE